MRGRRGRGLATDKKVARRLVDKDGMIRLGSDDEAPVLHVGAYTPQIPTIDMVVNTAWADDIEMATDNGLLISTDRKTPESIRKPLERLVGKDASVQILDITTRGNQRGTVGEIDRDVVAIFKTWGFAWGGDWRWTDPMHFELAEVKRAG